MTTKRRCPNPKGCDGELYARADDVPGLWCPKCGYVFRSQKRDDSAGTGRPGETPKRP